MIGTLAAIDVGFIGHGLGAGVSLPDVRAGRARYRGDTVLTDGAGTVHMIGDCRADVRTRPSPDSRSVK